MKLIALGLVLSATSFAVPLATTKFSFPGSDYSSGPHSIGCTKDGDVIVLQRTGGTLKRWNGVKPTADSIDLGKANEWFGGLLVNREVSPNGAYFINGIRESKAGTSSYRVDLMTVPEGDLLWSIKEILGDGRGNVGFSSNSRFVWLHAYTEGENSKLWLYDIEKRESLAPIIMKPKTTVRQLSNDARWIAVMIDNVSSILDLTQPEAPIAIPFSQYPILGFSPTSPSILFRPGIMQQLFWMDLKKQKIAYALTNSTAGNTHRIALFSDGVTFLQLDSTVPLLSIVDGITGKRIESVKAGLGPMVLCPGETSVVAMENGAVIAKHDLRRILGLDSAAPLDLERLYSMLSDTNPLQVYRAVRELARRPAASQWVEQRLTELTSTPDADREVALRVDLDNKVRMFQSDEFAQRQESYEELCIYIQKSSPVLVREKLVPRLISLRKASNDRELHQRVDALLEHAEARLADGMPVSAQERLKLRLQQVRSYIPQ